MKNKALLSIFLIVFIDLLGFSLILPLLPYYALQFGANDAVVGLLVAVYAAAQMISAPLWGRLSDRIGRRPVLLISIIGAFLIFLILGFANSLWVLFASRILAGIFGGNISVAQAYISDVTDQKNRARGLGLIGAAFGLGFIIGPALGGILSQWGFSLPSFIAAGVSLINFLLVLTWLPESLTQERRSAMMGENRTPMTFTAMLSALKRPLVGPLLHTRFLYALAFSLFQSIFTLYVVNRFQLDARNSGYILAYVGFLAALTQGLAVGKVTARYHDRQIIFVGMLVMAFGLAAWGLAPSIPVLLIALIPIAVAGGILNTVINSALSKSVQPAEVGGTLGLSASLESLSRVISPTLGGIVLAKLGTTAPGVIAALFLLWLSTYVWRYVHLPVPGGEAVPTQNGISK